MALRILDSSGNNLTSTNSALDINIKSSSGGITISNFPATQPISATSLPLPTGAALDATSTSGAQKTQVVNGSGVVVDVSAKNTQGANFVAMQAAKDTGRTKVVLTATKATGVTTEALMTMTIKKGTATTTTSTAYTVTSGKTLRIETVFLGMTNVTTAAVTNVAIRLREGASSGGSVSATSDIIGELEAGNSVATLQTNGQAWMMISEGMEILSAQQIGVSQLAQSTNCQLTVVIIGYEY